MKRRNIADSAAAQRLRCAGDSQAMDKILQQECRRRASRKLAATLLCPDFRFPTSLSAEQCTSDEIARIHADMVQPGASVLDMTCGLGIDAFHIARRASSVIAIDINHDVAGAVGHNAAALGLDNVTGVCADSAEWLADRPDVRFDVVFIDPARRSDSGRRVFGLSDCTPDVISLLPLIRCHTDRLIVKASPMLDIKALIRDEGLRPAHIYAIGTRSECKELVLDFRFGEETDDPVIHAVTSCHGETSFRMSQSASARAAVAAVGDLVPGVFVAEPWPAVMKAGGYDLLPGHRLHPSTHIYIIEPGEEEFPGDVYTVESVTEFSSSNVRRLGREGVDGSVAVRNFPLSADELRKRLKARESDCRRIMGVTAASGRVLLTLSAVR